MSGYIHRVMDANHASTNDNVVVLVDIATFRAYFGCDLGVVGNELGLLARAEECESSKECRSRSQVRRAEVWSEPRERRSHIGGAESGPGWLCNLCGVKSVCGRLRNCLATSTTPSARCYPRRAQLLLRPVRYPCLQSSLPRQRHHCSSGGPNSRPHKEQKKIPSLTKVVLSPSSAPSFPDCCPGPQFPPRTTTPSLASHSRRA